MPVRPPKTVVVVVVVADRTHRQKQVPAMKMRANAFDDAPGLSAPAERLGLSRRRPS